MLIAAIILGISAPAGQSTAGTIAIVLFVLTILLIPSNIVVRITTQTRLGKRILSMDARTRPTVVEDIQKLMEELGIAKYDTSADAVVE